ncbi:hypothetical protein ONE63_011608 [Megalurothrips usitatus]|uniref:Luciferin 4-monooxygenase n=1 Tax=Megalurothrips usitatus TaxID=439358 RepID=A0AAV7X2W7_9NEOP|nr:hypothetical protein ONE63_011608 [Megalurothrips usitatus]
MDAEHVVRGDAAPAVPHTTIGCYLLEKLREHGGASAQVDVTTGETQTYSEILEKSVRIARRMQELGIGPGDVVGIASENSLDFCLPVLATFYVGAVCAPFNPAYTEEELMHAMSISRPRMIFASALTLHKVNAVAGKLGCVRELVLIGRQTPTALSATVRRLSDLCSACTGSSATFCPAYVDPETSTCLILCSSGTTGLPKGVELSHRNYLQHAITT